LPPDKLRLELRLAPIEFLWLVTTMSAQEMIAEFKALPPAERAQVAKFVVEHDDSWIPDEFKEAMKDAEAGRFVDMETALRETPPPRLQ
jgi:predicted transcriptional regulator